MEVGVINFGGRINFLKTPDKDGKLQNVVLHLDSLEQYLSEDAYFGAVIGRYGNRIMGGKFVLDGKIYQLAQNNGQNHLHGGMKGYDKVVWQAKVLEGNKLQLSYFSKHMEEGYPGNLKVTVTYELDEKNSFHVEYEAETDQKTIVNLTQHSYFNLSGNFSEEITNHFVQINADTFLPVDENMIPTGVYKPVEKSVFDFRKEKRISSGIGTDDPQLNLTKGYDHTWVLTDSGEEPAVAASAWHEGTGISLKVLTTEPGVQFYTANFLNGKLLQPDGGVYKERSGFCFETQHFPNSPNEPKFPSVVLEPEEKYHSKTIFRFSTRT